MHATGMSRVRGEQKTNQYRYYLKCLFPAAILISEIHLSQGCFSQHIVVLDHIINLLDNLVLLNERREFSATKSICLKKKAIQVRVVPWRLLLFLCSHKKSAFRERRHLAAYSLPSPSGWDEHAGRITGIR
jgi:hypothetical protein